jgi:hypothetical protein
MTDEVVTSTGFDEYIGAFAQLGRTAQKTEAAFAQFAQAVPKLDPLAAMGFDGDERERLIKTAQIMHANPIELGRFIMALRPLPAIRAQDFFIFSIHFDWRKAVLLTLALVIAAAKVWWGG